MELASQILSDVTIYNKYARFLKDKKRRETWNELVDRNKEMHIRKYPELKNEIEAAYTYVYSKKILPSMRSLQFGGKAIETSNARIFNCSYLAIDAIESFSETMFLLLSGTGVGYSVQKRHIDKLPPVHKPLKQTRKYLVGDSIEGWADAVKVLMKSYLKPNSLAVRFDFSAIREKGAELVTSGGKAPGPDPLRICLEAIREILESIPEGEQLQDFQVHDILCLIADAVLAGGIRRAALISLFGIDSEVMLVAKSNFKLIDISPVLKQEGIDEFGEPVWANPSFTDTTGVTYRQMNFTVDEPGYGITKGTAYIADTDLSLIQNLQIPWYYVRPHRGRANNSVVLVRHKLKKKADFWKVWKLVEASGSGEPGFFLTEDPDWGCNPCAEIALRSCQFCNLTEVNVSDVTDQEDLNNRVRAAAFIGTLQAGYTDLHYLRPIWKKNTEKEALIGVGLTGIASGNVLKLNLETAAEVVRAENKRVAKWIGINSAARCCTIKPAGTTSCVLGCSSGNHAWHDFYFLRRMRVGKNEYLYQYLQMMHPELLEDDLLNPTMGIICLPQKAPDGSITRAESAVDLLERVKTLYNNWIVPGHVSGTNTHNVSTTVTVKEHEWDQVGNWLWTNRNCYTGISVLPFDTGTYKQPPFESITRQEYEEKVQKLMEVDLSLIREDIDLTNLKDQVACAGGACTVE